MKANSLIHAPMRFVIGIRRRSQIRFCEATMADGGTHEGGMQRKDSRLLAPLCSSHEMNNSEYMRERGKDSAYGVTSGEKSKPAKQKERTWTFCRKTLFWLTIT